MLPGVFKSNKALFILLLIGIFILGGFLRTIKLDTVPIELFGDEVDAGYQAYSLLTTGRDYKGNFLPIYIQSFSEWRAPGFMYSMVPFIYLFGLNEWGVRLTAAFWGMVSLVGFYLLLKEVGTKTGTVLLALFLLAISPWHIQYSRAGFEPTLLSSLVIFGALFLLRALRNGKLREAILAAIVFGLSFYAYNTANVFVPLFVIGLIYLYPGSSKRKSNVLRFFLLVLVMVIPLLFSVLQGHAADRYRRFSVFYDDSIVDKINRYRSVSGENKFLGLVFHNKPFLWTKKIVSNYLNSFSPDFLFGHGDVTFRHSLHEVGGFFWTEAILIVLGLLTIARKKELQFNDKAMIFWLLLSPAPASLTIDGSNHASRLFYMIFPLVYFASVGGLSLIEKLQSARSRLESSGYKIILVLVSLAIAIEFLNYQHYYWAHYPIESWRWWHYGYKEAIASINSLASSANYRKIIIENTYEPAYIRYLFWTKVDPRVIFNVSDTLRPGAVDGLSGFCLPGDKVCFVDFGSKAPQDIIQANTLYLISQERNVPGDWDWEKTPPKSVRVIKTIRNPYGTPIFYLITASPEGKT